MRKAIKVTPGIITLAIIVAIATPSFLLTLPCSDINGNYNWGRTANDLHSLGYAAKAVTTNKDMTLEDWDRVESIDDFAALVGPLVEWPPIARFDSKGQPLVFEKQKLDDRIILTIRSTYQAKRRVYCFWFKDLPPLALEITVFRDREKLLRVKELWRGE